MKATAVIQDAIAEAREDLDQIRDHVADLQAERREVAGAPCDRAEAEDRVRSLIEGARARGRDLFHRPELFTAAPQGVNSYFQRRLADEPLATLAVLVPDELADALLEHHEGGGLSADTRLAKLAELDSALLAAEIAEELAAREIENGTGGAVPRRLDADPGILLAPAHELEPHTDSPPAGTGTTNRRS